MSTVQHMTPDVPIVPELPAKPSRTTCIPPAHVICAKDRGTPRGRGPRPHHLVLLSALLTSGCAWKTNKRVCCLMAFLLTSTGIDGLSADGHSTDAFLFLFDSLMGAMISRFQLQLKFSRLMFAPEVSEVLPTNQ